MVWYKISKIDLAILLEYEKAMEALDFVLDEPNGVTQEDFNRFDVIENKEKYITLTDRHHFPNDSKLIRYLKEKLNEYYEIQNTTIGMASFKAYKDIYNKLRENPEWIKQITKAIK